MKKYGKRMQFDGIATMENREKQERRLQSLEG